eukprot:snap_masked-scaffold_30-processed-gene-2.47-mRNA-1 protein AED:1.00 eAED:1.00 QI:0/0/0/0/1/1/3/0/72
MGEIFEVTKCKQQAKKPKKLKDIRKLQSIIGSLLYAAINTRPDLGKKAGAIRSFVLLQRKLLNAYMMQRIKV